MPPKRQIRRAQKSPMAEGPSGNESDNYEESSPLIRTDDASAVVKPTILEDELESRPRSDSEVRPKTVSRDSRSGANAGVRSLLTPPAEAGEEDRTGEGTLLPPMTSAQLSSILAAFRGSTGAREESGMESASREARRRRDELVRDMTSYSEGSDLSAYIRGLEAQLSEIAVPSREWKRVVLNKLPSSIIRKVTELIEAGESYDVIKNALVRNNGKCLRTMAMGMFPNRKPSVKDQVELAREVVAEIERICMLCPTWDDIKIFMAKNYYSCMLTPAEITLLNGQNLTSLKDLVAIAFTLRDSQLVGKKEERVVERANGEGPRCFICKRRGHKAYNSPDNNKTSAKPSNNNKTTNLEAITNLPRTLM